MKKPLIALAAAAALMGTAACGRSHADEPAVNEPAATPEAGPEVVSRATSATGDSYARLNEAMGAEGPWVFGATSHIEAAEPILIEGNVYKNNNEEEGYMRKIGLYRRAGNGDRTIVEVFNLTAPTITTHAENTRIMGGIVDGHKAEVHSDIYVNAPGFILEDVDVHGDVIFATEAYRDSASIEETGGVVHGEIRVAE